MIEKVEYQTLYKKINVKFNVLFLKDLEFSINKLRSLKKKKNPNIEFGIKNV